MTTSNNVSNTKIEYPLLTDEVLELLIQRLASRTATGADFKLVDHYLTTAGYKGLLKRVLWKQNVFSFDEAGYCLNKFSHHASAEVFGILRGCLVLLQECVDNGQKIY